MFKKKKKNQIKEVETEVSVESTDTEEKKEPTFREELKELAVPIGIHEAMSAFYKVKLVKHVVFKGGKIVGQQVNRKMKERKTKI